MIFAERRQLVLAATAAALVAGAVGFVAGAYRDAPTEDRGGRAVLYWYDPMVPSQHFDKPGKSPFMDMQLVPRYAGEGESEAGVRIDPARVENLGLRTAIAKVGTLDTGFTAAGAIDFNERDAIVIQARAAGFVQRVYSRAPGDVVGAGAPLADLLVPEWGGAQTEFLAARRTGDAALTRAARQRMTLIGMPAGAIAAVERTGRPQNVLTVTTPAGGLIKTLGVRAGMSIAAGQTLAEINGLGTVWLNAAIPEALGSRVRPGQPANASLAAYPGERFPGRISAVLPAVEGDSRTLTARIELINRGGRLRPGMFAQVALGGMSRPALLVPEEAVIRTGTRTIVMLAQPGGRYQPAEVQIGATSKGQTEVIAGLGDGERVVASGQFLLDSETTLAGAQVRSLGAAKPVAPATARPTYQAEGSITAIDARSVTISHGPIPAIKWPAMQMRFLSPPATARAFKRGDRVSFSFDQPPEGPTIRRISKLNGR
ncbi:efflux RND transporter periplasmic adaptor subunit [Parablastomonas sp. CN1-191]|uniref:efflux RND transporter periplasmic adaptor subunit n=1 Tax=Parablastomonas sp. CN1-191 TaxID=3400908 RepID=UPI003BF90CCF